VIPQESIDEAEAIMTPAQRAPYDRIRQELQVATRALHRVADELDSDDGSNTDRLEEALREAVDRQRQLRNGG
jgi:hypothetical protein